MRRRSAYSIDHVHILVSDRELAAAWYELTLGFQRLEVTDDPYGPLVMSGDGGATCFALFTSKVKAQASRVVALRVGAEEFLAFAVDLEQRELRGTDGTRLTPESFSDHGDVLSYYFADPDGNVFEVCTRETEAARLGLRGLAIRASRTAR